MKILMTGCSSGFGVHVRHKLIELGNEVFGVGLGGPDLSLDFTALTPRHAVDAVKAAGTAMGGLDTLIFNAGTTHINFLGDHTEAEFDNVLKVNLSSAFYFARSFYHATSPTYVRKVFQRRMVFTTSMGAVSPLRGSPGYCASKAGLEMVVRVIAKELAGKEPYVVTGVAPGMVDKTEMNKYVIERLMDSRGMTEDAAKMYATSLCPINRPCTHEEVFKVFDMALGAPEYMTGHIFRMPGGG